ncbi:MAG TPA: glycosyltransferase family 4 protein [Anaerolineaceae bacterium]|nr:glycosyltransferase family 4 protein [Anaerolineaceae bacterium]
MKLGFYYHVPALQKPDGIYTPGFQGRFIDSLAARCESVTCFLHSPWVNETEMMDYRLGSGNVTLVDIGPHGSVPRRLLHSGHTRRQVAKHTLSLDVMLIRGPSALLPVVARGARAPVALLLVNDYLTGLKNLNQPWWRGNLIRAWAMLNYQQQMRVSRRSLNIVNNRALYQQLSGKVPWLIETRTTTLTNADFYRREDTCQEQPLRLLFSGRITREKGVLDVIEALARVVSAGADVVLDLVGIVEEKENILQAISELAARRGLSERVQYHGYRAVGADLFSFYQQADLFVLASQSAFEGFPRTVWEAMAHSLPVIATRVGSIPELAQDAALLVEPGDAAELARAIMGLISSPRQRQALIKKGMELAKENTLETQVSKMVQDIQDWLRNP